MEKRPPSIFTEKFGLKRRVMAMGVHTSCGGGLMWPKAVEYMAEAAKDYVGMFDLRRAAGEVVAKACGAEAGCVTTGAASSLMHAAAAFMTGKDLYKIHLLPDTRHIEKNEIFVQKSHNYRWIRYLTMVGAKICSPALSVGHPWYAPEYVENELAMNDKIAGIYTSVAPTRWRAGEIPLQILVKIAHKYDVPVYLDVAPFGYDMKKYLAMGVDLCGYSMGKMLRGPSNAGFIVGSEDLVEACFLQWYGIGRPLKIEKECIMGLVGAVEELMERGSNAYEYRRAECIAILDTIQNGLRDLPGIQMRRIDNKPELETGRFRDELYVYTKNVQDAAKLANDLMAGDIEIEAGCLGSRLEPLTLREPCITLSGLGFLDNDEVEFVIKSIRELWPYK